MSKYVSGLSLALFLCACGESDNTPDGNGGAPALPNQGGTAGTPGSAGSGGSGGNMMVMMPTAGSGGTAGEGPLGGSGGTGGTPDPGAKPKVLFVSGSNHHDWLKQDPYLINILKWSKVFESVEYMIMPAASDDASWAAWRPAWTDYDVVVHNLDLTHGNFGRDWPNEVKTDFENYMKNGGGMASLHAGTHGWENWAEYNKMTGGGWRSSSFGCSIEIVNGQRTVVPPGVGPDAADVPFTDQLIRVLDPENPITKGLPAVWKMITDNSSVYQRGPCESVTVLDYAYSQTGGIDGYFPVSWTNQYGEGRFFFIAPMHLMTNSPAGTLNEMDDVGFQTMWIRGVEWAAKGMVTYPVPANFPTETAISRNDLSNYQE
jgi:type 1 glutamine amidotransferase